MSLDVFQQVFYLSLCANLVNDREGTQTSLQETLQKALQQEFTSKLPGWQLAWGPVVWKNKPEQDNTGPDNSWYVAFNPALQFEDGSVYPAYVVAVAGTPAKSEYVWTQQNFAVNAVADFNLWVANGIQNPPVVVPAARVVPGTPYIARGTVNAVHLLLTIPAPSGAAGAGTTLLDFVASLDWSGSARIITTGHSLGGALSPALALALVSAGVTPGSNTLVYPTAGASPGNQGFTDLFTATFPARKSSGAHAYQGWNLNLVNTLDIVPQAWSVRKVISPKQNLGNIPPIYGKPVLRFVQGITIVFAFYALSSGALYLPLPSQYITGTLPPTPPKDLEEFLQDAFPQHGLVYYQEVGIIPPTLDDSKVPNSGTRKKRPDEVRFNFPVIAEMEWAREHPAEAEKEIEKVEGSKESKSLLDEM